MAQHQHVRTGWHGAALACCLFAATCGGGATTAPSGKITVSGLVGAATGVLGGARVEITSGANSGQATTSDGAGRYVLANLAPGALTLRVSAPGYIAQTRSLTPTTDQASNFTLSAAPFSIAAHAVDCLSQAPLSGVIVEGFDISGGASDPAGALSIFAATASAAPRQALVSGAAIIQRQIGLRIPGSDVTLALIPAAFDMAAYDQLLRTNSQSPLRRWTTPPGLTVETRTLKFVDDTSFADAVALPEQMSDADVAALVTDLSFALPLMTGGTFTAFSSVVIQTSDPGQSVQLQITGRITVSRQSGLSVGFGGALGVGSWQTTASSVVVGGTIALDRDRDVGSTQQGVRYHELGHALGYDHVTTRTSIMNPTCCAVVQPNQFDQEATRIAFQRQPGSLSPDKDPVTTSLNLLGLPAVWSPPIR